MSTEITYSGQGDYYLPELRLPEQESIPIGIWGLCRRRYLKEHHKILYYNLLTSCKLHDHLAEINEGAEEMLYRLIKQMAKKEGITEQLKAENQMLWVRLMKCVRNWAEETVMNEIIYV